MDESATPRPRDFGAARGVGLLLLVAAGAALDHRFGWFETAFDFVAHLFYEVPGVSALRRPSQLILARRHAAIWLALIGCVEIVGVRSRAARRFGRLFCLAYGVRALIWIVGSNLPLVPGDSAHYVEVAASVHRGEGPVKHYVESFFSDYPSIRQGKGVLDDWATPLYAYVLAFAYRVAGVDPAGNLESTFAVAKATSFVLNLLCLPALYVMMRRRSGERAAEIATALLAVLPVHALYAGFELRESLVALTSIVAVWFLIESGNAEGRARWIWIVAAGVSGGLAILARNTAMALLAGAALFALIAYGRRMILPLFVWGLLILAVIAPWAIETQRVYGEVFYTYTKYFQYTFSWTVHHYAEGRPSASTFYTWANAPEILRVKAKALTIVVATSTMVFGLPLVVGLLSRCLSRKRGEFEWLAITIALAFVGGTLANVADVTQVAQLGRYYLPMFCLLIPSAALAIRDAEASLAVPPRIKSLLCASCVALLWSDPTWAYDYTWLVKPYQLHWPALTEAGEWVRTHPEAVPTDARIMTWFPWEFRFASQRTTILMPRNYQAARIEQVIKQYGVTHVLWGSFDDSPGVDPEIWGPYLEGVKVGLGLNERTEVFRSSKNAPRFPVRLYRVRGGGR